VSNTRKRVTRKRESVMFKANAVREAAIAASTTMGYERMKSEQLQIVESFVTGHDMYRPVNLAWCCTTLLLLVPL